MNKECEYIQERMPEYLAGELSEKEKEEVERHIEKCSECKNELEDLQNPVLAEAHGHSKTDTINGLSKDDISKLIMKTRRRFIFSTVKVVLSVLLILVVIYVGAISILRATKHNNNFYNGFSADTITSAIVPFRTHGMTVIGGALKDKYTINTYEQFGLEEIKIGEIKYTEDVLSGNLFLSSTEYEDSMFMKTELGVRSGTTVQEWVRSTEGVFTNRPENNFIKEKKRLEMNKDNTIVLLDLEFSKDQDLEYIRKLCNNYDILTTWIALKNEGDISKDQLTLSPKYFGLSIISRGGKSIIDDVESYKNDMNFFIESSAKFKNLLIDQIDATYKVAIGKDLKNIKGIRVTGPTTEVYKLVNDIQPSDISVVKMDFWNWR